jgi:hypothetical protein
MDKDSAIQKLEENMKNEGFATQISADTISITGKYADAKGRILIKTNEMVARTIKLNEYYQS